MRKLDRGPAPDCLADYDYRKHNWDRDLSPDCKAAIWEALNQMQGSRCAYCERPIAKPNQHVEHFRRKGLAISSHLAFAWSNLFGSCSRPKECGLQKDYPRHSYHPDDLIKPDEMEPREYLRFEAYGTVSPRNGLRDEHLRRAGTTIRVLRLDYPKGSLRQMRKAALAMYVRLAEEILKEIDEYPNQLAELAACYREEMGAIRGLPFEGVIRCFLRDALPRPFYEALGES